ncbi:translocation/assembly module TamB domain-containing protein [Treponema phagedenis]|uniref:translocation/assembly module TamB domain-containing protein n=1 Tax=Treponema phagedenis TaxID=162 RepID=UPI0011ECD74C|nr:translocation/assembly module TamB domain-containing protein [Treponema phagedenis]TYT77938.1 hypothetical protein FS559_01750 [Treponema phagedenis]
MNPKTRTRRIELSLLFAVAILAAIIFQPISKAVEKRLVVARDAWMDYVEDLTGLKFEYESLSPSIFRSILLKNVSVYDAEKNEKIAFFSRINLKYNFWALFSGDALSIIKAVHINDGDIEFSTVKNSSVAEKISRLLKSDEPAADIPEQETEQFGYALYHKLTNLDIRIQNTKINFSDSVQKLAMTIPIGSFTLDADDIIFKMNFETEYFNTKYADFGQLKTAAFAEGKFDKRNSSGTASFGLETFKGDRFVISPIRFFAFYRESLLTVTTIRDVQPFDISATWKPKTGEIHASFNCENMRPLEWIRFLNQNNFVIDTDSNISGEITADYVPSKGLTWNSDIRANIPVVKFSNSYHLKKLVAQINASGDESKIRVKKLRIDSPQAVLSSFFTFDLKQRIPEGSFFIDKFTLPSGKILSARAYFNKRGRRYFCSVPLFRIGAAELHDIQLAATPEKMKTDFNLSAKDESGYYSFDGSITYGAEAKKTKAFLEVHSAFDAVNVGTIYKIASSFSPQKNTSADSIADALSSMQATTEFYISSDFSDFSYNFIRLVVASNKVNNLYALFSLKGNQSSFSITDINCSYKGLDIRGDVHANFEQFNDIIFESFFAVNTTAYHFQGFYTDRSLTVYGDYGLTVAAYFDSVKGLIGSAQVKELPVPLLPLFFSLDSEFSIKNSKSWEFICKSGRFGYDSLRTFVQTGSGLDFKGKINQGGAFFNEVKIGTDLSYLFGTAAFSKIPDADPQLTRFSSAISLNSTDQTEQFAFNSDFTLSDTLYFNGSSSIENIDLRRFLSGQNEESRVSGSMNFLGTPQNFSFNLLVENFNAIINGTKTSFVGGIGIDDGTIAFLPSTLHWGNYVFSEIHGSCTPEQSFGQLNFMFNGGLAGKESKANCSIQFSGLKSEEGIKQNMFGAFMNMTKEYTIVAGLKDWEFGEYSGKETQATFIREKGVTALYAGNNDEIAGFILDDGTLSLQLADSLPVHFSLNGSIKDKNLDLNFSNLFVQLKPVWDFTGLDYVLFYDGTVSGDVKITGTVTEPQFKGRLAGRKILVNSPNYVPEIYGPVSLDVILDGTNLLVPYTELRGPSATVWAEYQAEFNGFIPDDMIIKCGTIGENLGVMKTNNLLFKADGYAGCDLVIVIDHEKVALNGSATFDKGYFLINFADFDKFNEKYSSKDGSRRRPFQMNLVLSAGHKTEFRWPTSDFPVIRTLVQADEPLELIVDPETGSFFMRGIAAMRGGEILWIKRNFYIKSGQMDFTNSENKFEPRISFQAEIRDRDMNGDSIRLMLSATDQPLLSFSPLLTSDPPRSNAELMQLFGQVVLGDTSKENIGKDVVIVASDLLTQWGLFKKAESKIRDFLHLDVFSLRTLVLQNAIFGNLFNKDPDKPLTIGNYFDNTSVYIGKYFGSAIYADALLHLSHYDPLVGHSFGVRRPVYGSLLFQPELGLEVATPFFLLRWGWAPARPDSLFVPDTSMRISWKFAY